MAEADHSQGLRQRRGAGRFKAVAGRGAALRIAAAFLLVALAGCATAPAPVTPLAPPTVACADFSFPIYFDKGADQITAAARQEIGYAAQRVRGCKLGKVEVLGLADADGRAHRNLVLSRRRAVVTAEALAAYGLPAPSFDIEALGKIGAVGAGGEPEPLRRRTEVVIRAEPAAQPTKP